VRGGPRPRGGGTGQVPWKRHEKDTAVKGQFRACKNGKEVRKNCPLSRADRRAQEKTKVLPHIAEHSKENPTPALSAGGEGRGRKTCPEPKRGPAAGQVCPPTVHI